MSVSNNYVPIKMLGNGVTTAFTGSWNAISENYLLVYLESVSTGVQTLQELDVDYTASVSDSVFTVSFVSAPSSSYYVVIGRNVEVSQTQPFKTSRGYQGDVLETSFDKLTCIAQQNKEIVNRAVVSPLGSAGVELPPATIRANKFLSFDSSGNPTASAGTTDTPISDAMEPVVSAASLAAARSAFNVYGSINKQFFTASGTYTPTTGMLSCIIECWGGGGGGGGMDVAVGASSGAGGGGGGGYSRTLSTAADIGASKTVTVGAAGAAGAAGNNAGGNGGETSVGTLCIAKGGSGGSGASAGSGGAGGLGGVSGTGNVIAATGQNGFSGIGVGNAHVGGFSGAGGGSFLGGGGRCFHTQSASVTGAAATGYGAGGGGACGYNALTIAAGGAGTAGIVIITEFSA